MNDAEALAGAELWLPEADARAAAGGNVLPARPGRLRSQERRAAQVSGRVTAVEGSLDRSYLVVGEHMMIPLVAGICVAVDIAGRRVTVDPPEGLIDLNPPGRTVAVKIDIVTIFPGWCKGALAEGIVGRAIARGRLDVRVHDLRDHATDRHRVVDDMPFGGGPGMVLKPEPMFAARGAHPRGAGNAGCGHPDVAGRRAVHPRGGRPIERASSTSWSCAAATKGSTSACARPGDRDDLDRRLRAVGRRTAGPGDRRRGGAAGAGRCRRRGIGGARYVCARAARLSAVHAAGGVSRHGACRRCCCRGITRRSRRGGAGKRWRERWSGGRTCWSASRSMPRTRRC